MSKEHFQKHPQIINKRGVSEQPEFSVPDSHTHGGAGTTIRGDSVHGSYKQPWVERDGVSDHTGENKNG